jgi:hypothetical protein
MGNSPKKNGNSLLKKAGNPLLKKAGNLLLKKKNKATLLSHASLNAKFTQLGTAFAGRVKRRGKGPRPANPPGHKDDIFRSELQRRRSGKSSSLVAEAFGKTYRNRLPAHDELVSTSSVRQLISAVLDRDGVSPLNAKDVGTMNQVFDNLSRVRVPTKYVGYATKSQTMQHPTSPGTGTFGDPRKTAALHSHHDVERKNAVAGAMVGAAAAPKASPVDIANAGLRAAIAYTLNDMMAPVTAHDVRPFTSKGASGSVSNSELDQVKVRETLKKLFVQLGGHQDLPKGSAGRSRKRSWTDRQGKSNLGSVSPERTKP